MLIIILMLEDVSTCCIAAIALFLIFLSCSTVVPKQPSIKEQILSILQFFGLHYYSIIFVSFFIFPLNGLYSILKMKFMEALACWRHNLRTGKGE